MSVRVRTDAQLPSTMRFTIKYHFACICEDGDNSYEEQLPKYIKVNGALIEMKRGMLTPRVYSEYSVLRYTHSIYELHNPSGWTLYRLTITASPEASGKLSFVWEHKCKGCNAAMQSEDAPPRDWFCGNCLQPAPCTECETRECELCGYWQDGLDW